MKIERYKLKMNYLHPSTKLQEQKHHMAEAEQKLRLIMEKKLMESKQRLAIHIERMKGLSPLTKLNQGFSYVTTNDGKTIKSIEHVKKDDELMIYVTDGIVKAIVAEAIREDYSER